MARLPLGRCCIVLPEIVPPADAAQSLSPAFQGGRRPVLQPQHRADPRRAASWPWPISTSCNWFPALKWCRLSVVEQAMQETTIGSRGPERCPAAGPESLGVDAVVIGAVTDYSPVLPAAMRPASGMVCGQSRAIHPIPPGYGLPWGTPEEQQIPGAAGLRGRNGLGQGANEDADAAVRKDADPGEGARRSRVQDSGQSQKSRLPEVWKSPRRLAADSGPATPRTLNPEPLPGIGPTREVSSRRRPARSGPPIGPRVARSCGTRRPTTARIREFTEALQSYHYFVDDARFGGWQNYLQRSDDFIRFCCHMHIWEMLSAPRRGGRNPSRVAVAGDPIRLARRPCVPVP